MIPPFFTCYSKECMYENKLSAFLYVNSLIIKRSFYEKS
ncbi:conserved hypothetical protein [Bacillus cereus AH187]|uniref:Uncharacterized protein n=1 Tax=Bacillus cereus (strain AH187) TaxID=405534 RepID=B7HSB6_BACC7|nr:conserved hypothetical protein [Bacillus cereus AH187]